MGQGSSEIPCRIHFRILPLLGKRAGVLTTNARPSTGGVIFLMDELPATSGLFWAKAFTSVDAFMQSHGKLGALVTAIGGGPLGN